MSSPLGTAQRAVEWTENNISAGARRIARWDKAAGFPKGTQWCGIFLGAAMRSQGLTPPSGYPAAVNWSTYGTAVKRNEIEPGDIIVYGEHHVAMYVGSGKQIQGNDANGTVGTSGIGSSLGLGPITAIRRPPYKSQKSQEGKKDKEEWSSFGPLGTAEEVLTYPSRKIAGFLEDEAGSLASEVVSGIVGDVAKSAEPLMLNIGLVGGGAFLIYYGISLMAGSNEPTVKLFQGFKRAGEVAAV